MKPKGTYFQVRDYWVPWTLIDQIVCKLEPVKLRLLCLLFKPELQCWVCSPILLPKPPQLVNLILSIMSMLALS
jgi:hypothetical protein